MNERIAIGGIWHETNGFAAGLTELADFHAYQYAEGAALLDRYRGTGTELGGMTAAAEQCGFELLPTLFAAAVPSATIARPALDALCDGILARLDASGAVDGMLLVLHGAAAAEEIDDADAYVLERVREVLPRSCPIAATFDFHANLSEAMVAGADVLVGYDTFPPRRHGRARSGGRPPPRADVGIDAAPGAGARQGAAADRAPEASHRPRAGHVHHVGAARARDPGRRSGAARWRSASPMRMRPISVRPC